ncbi:hypothetical protein IQ06DRAFT_377003 [Phaeosphaeriaceae sp. SRC1lsM3a]|nr:hypothetical protein IQ06DRAFT_377003 [Stagonospora sp. SRC1lsM3a]
MQDLTATSGVKSWSCSLQLKLPLTPNTRCKTIIRRLVGLRHWYRLTSLGPMSWTLKRSLWIASSDRYPVSFNKEDRERSTSLSRRPARPFLRRPSTNGVTLQTTSGATVTNLAVCAIPEVPRVRTRSRSQDALIPWRQPRRHSFSGSQGPGISTMNHALPLFQTSRGHQRGMGINSGLLPMEIPDLSLRNTFSPPLLKDRPDRPKTSTCSMCNYTYVHLECGHRVDDVADLRDCPYFEEHGRMPCDPNDPANRGRVSIKAESRPGICNTCRRRQQEVEEMEALRRDEEGAERESLSEAKQSEKTAKAHEEKLLIESREDFERQRRKGEQEDEDMEYMPQRSREEAEAGQVQQKQDDLAKVLEASCVNLHGDPKTMKEVDDHIPPPPPLSQDPVQLPSPPATPVRSTRPRPAEKPAAPVDYSLPVGQQEYGAYTIGGRRAPVHESQKPQAARYLRSPSTPISPAPVARLGGTIQPSSPSPRPTQAAASPVPVSDLRSGLRRTGGPRRTISSRTDSDDGAELRAHLARRRTLPIVHSEPGSNLHYRASSPTGSDLSRASTACEDYEAEPQSKLELDGKRKTGCSKE